MIEIELWQLIGLMATLPLAFIGIFILFKKLAHLMMVRKGYIKLLFFTQNKMIREDLRKPQSKTISVGNNKSFMFDPRNIFRWGHTPTLAYNEESVDSLNPLEETTKLTPRRLDDVQFNAFNAGKRTVEKKEKIMQILLILAVIAAVGAASMSIMLWQSMNAMEGVIRGEAGGLREYLKGEIANIPQTTATNNITVLK